MKVSVAASLAAVLAGAAACTPSGSPTDTTLPPRPTRSGNVIRFAPTSPQLERIKVAEATDAVLPVDEFELPGKVGAVPTRVARLAPAAPGRVRDVRVTLGDRVSAGEVLLTIDTPDVSLLQSAVRQALADIKQREAALAKAEADASRVRDLFANRAIAQKEVLVAEAELAVATAAMEQARATRDDVTRRLGLLGVTAGQGEALANLRAPISGEVVEIAVAPGEYRSDTAAAAIVVADLSRVWIVASVPEALIHRVEVGQSVTIAIAAYPDRSFVGRIARVAGALDPATRSLDVIAEVANDQRLLKPEMFARIRYSGPSRPVLTVPAGAIVQDEESTTVFVERTKGEFERRDVSVGPRRNESVVVLSGLTQR